MNNYDEMNAEQRYDAMEKDFNAAIEQKDGIPGYGLEGAVVPPKAGFGLTGEDVKEQEQPELSTVVPNSSVGMPTKEEIEAAKQKVDGMVYESVRQDDFNTRTNNLFNSLENKNDPVPPVEPVNEQNSFTPPVDGSYDSILASLRSKEEMAKQNALDAELQQTQAGVNRQEFLSNVTAETSQYIMAQKQAVHVEDRSLDPNLVEKIKTAGKAALIAFMLAGAIKLTADVIKEPELPVQDPVQIEQEMQERQAEEQRIQELREQALQSEPDYNTYYDKDGNLIVYDNNNQEERKKVISIQSNEQNYEEDVTKGVRN